MRPVVQAALDNAQAQLSEAKRKENEELALSFNLFEREYAPDGKYSEEYPFYSKKDNPPRYFRKVPLELSPDESEALRAMKALTAALPAQKEEIREDAAKEDQSLPTPMSTVFNVIGIAVLVLTFLLAIGVGTGNSDMFAYFGYGTRGMTAVIVAVAGILQSILCFAIAKVISLLNAVAFNTRALRR